MKLSNGTALVPVEGEEAKDFAKYFGAYHTGLLRVGADRYLLPKAYTRWAQQYLDFKFRSSDVVVDTYPKCGTTWMQEIVWTMTHNPNLDHPDTKVNLSIRSPFLEFDSLVATLCDVTGHNLEMVEALKKLAPDASPDDGLFLKLAEHVPDRRVIKTHLPFSVLPKDTVDTCKVVYVVRNPKDLVSSYLHHHRLIKIHDFKGSDDQFVDYFCRNDLFYGSYGAHLAEAWALKDRPNLYIVHFEDLKKDMIGELTKLNAFLETGLTHQQIENVALHTSFSRMKERSGKRLTQQLLEQGGGKKEPETTADANHDGHGITGLFDKDLFEKTGFYRKGESGAWKTDLSPTNAAKIDKWTEEHVTSRMGLRFSYGN